MLKIKKKNIQPIQLIAYSDKWTSYTSTKQKKYTKDAQVWKTKLNTVLILSVGVWLEGKNWFFDTNRKDRNFICNDGYINGNMSGLDIIENKVTCIV